jgi:hypothetical protein
MLVPPRSPLPSRTNRVVNPGGPDKKRAKRTSAEMAAAAQQKKKLKLALEQMERDKIRMLAEMEEVEEQEERDEERTRIKDIAVLAESDAGGETNTQYDKEGMATGGDNDIVMADGENDEEVNGVFDDEPELEGPDTVKKVIYGNFVDDCQWLTLFRKRGKQLGLGGTFEQRLTSRKKCLVNNQRMFFFSHCFYINFLTTCNRLNIMTIVPNQVTN